MEKPFPLFRLPRLAIEEVISTMTPFEIINFSMTSLKIKCFIKCFLRTSRNSQYVLQMHTNEDPAVSIKGSETTYEFTVTSDKTKDGMSGMREFKYFMEIKKIYTLWMYSENVIDGWMKMVKIVKEIFKFKKHYAIFIIDTFPTRNKAIVDFMKSQTPSIDGCEIYGNAETDQDVEYFLININVTNCLEMISRLSDHFKFPQVNFLDTCTLDPANWLTFDQLLYLKGARLLINGSLLTNQELNQFLILWMTSQCHQNLSFLRINITDPESIDIILDLPHKVMNPNLERIVTLPNNNTALLYGGIDIKRNDGMTGTIYCDWREEEMELTMVIFRNE
ncbi:hypothetical protein CRE_11240 [Caenorhabditis remanei]|uniref:Sdz-33 F-box domain-containing protein n=1 Tax=Caenorhabditis remanei TaxID=31234 RepID=E3MQ53_CAERE|nr:hypothetical protein CRE_11240 [Caenorhabditis remanei]